MQVNFLNKYQAHRSTNCMKAPTFIHNSHTNTSFSLLVHSFIRFWSHNSRSLTSKYEISFEFVVSSSFCTNEISFTFLCDSSALQPLTNGRCLIACFPFVRSFVYVGLSERVSYKSKMEWKRSIEQMLIELVQKKCFLWFFFFIYDCLLVFVF